MHSSVNFDDVQIDTLKKLLSAETVGVLDKKGGGNSKVYCVDADGQKWALKCYPSYAPNQRDRLAAESQAYRFLNQQQVNAVPYLHAVCEQNRWLIMSWVEGEIPKYITDEAVEQAIHFIQTVANKNESEAAKLLPQAAEACTSLTILCDQIQKRCVNLLRYADQEPLLHSFLRNDFAKLFAQVKQDAYAQYEQHQMDPVAILQAHKQSLIPADFGFHNAILDPVGKLHFFDFDYFGWDDPVKLLADILWHPKMRLSDKHVKQFISALIDIYQTDPLFEPRFTATWRLYGLRWALILLNEFIPVFWQNRQHAESHRANTLTQTEAKLIQLAKAKALMQRMQEGFLL